MASLLKPRNVILAAIAAYLLMVATAYLERRAAGASTDAIVSAAVAIANAPPDRAAAVESMMRPMIANYPIVMLVGIVISWVLLTTVFYIAFMMVEAGLTWGTVFAASVYASLAQAAGALLLTGILAISRQPTVDDIIQRTFLSTNASAILSPESAPWLLVLGRQFDALTFLYLLIFTAVLAESGRSKASQGALTGVVGTAFALWIVARVGWAFAFGR